MSKIITIIYSTCYQSRNASNQDKTIGVALLFSLIVIVAGTVMITQKLK